MMTMRKFYFYAIDVSIPEELSRQYLVAPESLYDAIIFTYRLADKWRKDKKVLGFDIRVYISEFNEDIAKIINLVFNNKLKEAKTALDLLVVNDLIDLHIQMRNEVIVNFIINNFNKIVIKYNYLIINDEK